MGCKKKIPAVAKDKFFVVRLDNNDDNATIDKN